MIPVAEGGGCYDISVTRVGEGYTELCRERESRRDRASSVVASVPVDETVVSAAKEQYLKNKREAADRRNAQKRLERLRAEAERREKELDGIDAEMNGEAASDYTRLSELDARKNELEERLLEIYGEI